MKICKSILALFVLIFCLVELKGQEAMGLNVGVNLSIPFSKVDTAFGGRVGVNLGMDCYLNKNLKIGANLTKIGYNHSSSYLGFNEGLVNHDLYNIEIPIDYRLKLGDNELHVGLFAEHNLFKHTIVETFNPDTDFSFSKYRAVGFQLAYQQYLSDYTAFRITYRNTLKEMPYDSKTTATFKVSFVYVYPYDKE